MILKYDEALKRAENPDWFRNFYPKEIVASDEEVDKINELAKKKGEHLLNEYFDQTEDFLLLKEYVQDIIDYLNNPDS